MTLRKISKAALWAGVLSASCLFGADEPARTPRRMMFGLRIETFPLRLFDVDYVEASSTSPVADYTYRGTTDSPKVAVGPTFEYRLSEHLAVAAEFRFHHANYKQVTEMKSGAKDPNSEVDYRKITTITETTKANYWEFPFLLRYYGIRQKGWLSRTYVSGGVEYRHVGKVRTGTEYSNADTTTDYNEVPASPGKSNQFGVVGGVGMRLIDEFHIVVTPEIRVIRWQGTTFSGPAYRSAANQYEAGIGFSF